MHDRARAWPLVGRPVALLRLGAGWLLALLLLAGAGAPAAPAGAPRLRPLPAELERRMPELVRAAESYRGLKLERRVPWGRVSEPELRREVIAEFREDLPPRRLAEVELGLKAFGLIPESMDLGTYVPELLTSQIAGYYDPHRKSLAVVDRPGGLLGREAGAQLGAEMAHKMEDGLLVHELTHAIQDQHFDLDRLSDPDPLSDGGVARLALVEGDATLVMMDGLMRAPLEDVPEARSLVAELTAAGGGDEDAPVAGKGLPGQKEMATAPAWFRDQLLFSYSRGAAFCLEVRRRGGQKLLDYAFAVDPPRSSEQILHPEKWFGRRDDPVVIVWPDLGRELPGYAKAAEGQLGEEGIAVLLRPAMADGAQAAGAQAAAAATGWGGDRFAVYQQARRRLLAWIADWDTEEAAARFQAAASRLGAGWTVVRAAPRRVTVLRGDLAAPERGAVLARLAAVRAEPPANHDIDLARLGVRPEPADPAATRPPGTPEASPAAPPPGVPPRSSPSGPSPIYEPQGSPQPAAHDERVGGVPPGAVRDPETGLIWTQRAKGGMNWEQAKSYCNGLTLGGYRDWTLPAIQQLEKLYDESMSDQCVNCARLGIIAESWVWSRSVKCELSERVRYPWCWRLEDSSSEALCFAFQLGSRGRSDRSLSNSALCVRR